MRRRSKLRVVVAGGLIAGAFGFVIAEGLGSALVYFRTASEAVGNRSAIASQFFNVEGAVVPGSIHRSGSAVDFQISSGRTVLNVVNHGSPPQLFRDGMPVVLSGHLVGSGRTLYFDSDQIMVKHSAQYVAAHPGRVKSPYSPLTTP